MATKNIYYGYYDIKGCGFNKHPYEYTNKAIACKNMRAIAKAFGDTGKWWVKDQNYLMVAFGRV